MISFFASRMAAAAGAPPPKVATYKDLVDISFKVSSTVLYPTQTNVSIQLILSEPRSSEDRLGTLIATLLLPNLETSDGLICRRCNVLLLGDAHTTYTSGTEGGIPWSYAWAYAGPREVRAHV